jgi:hypothetical protein
MSEQATATAETGANGPVVIAASRPANARRPKGAEIRIRELLKEVKTLKGEQIERERAHSAELEKLRGELLHVLAENSDFKAREEARLWQVDEDSKTARQVADDHRLLCFRALVDVAHQTNVYALAPDFDTRMKRAEQLFSTDLVEEILCFPRPIIAQMAYVVASDEKLARRLSSLAVIPAVFVLCGIAQQFADAAKLRQLIGG